MTPRATPLPPEARRAAIIEAALPLLEQHGPDLTTRMVAKAAGVAEGTLFRVFPTLDDLLDATFSEYLSQERLAARLAAVDLGDTLESRTRGALTGLVNWFSSVHYALHSPKAEAKHGSASAAGMQCYKDRFVDLRDWLVDVFTPHAAELSVPVASFAHFLKTLAIGHVMGRREDISLDDTTRFALTGAQRKEQA